MAVFIRPNRGNVATKSIHSELMEGVKLELEEGYCLSLVAKPVPLFDKDGQLLEEPIVKAAQRCTLNFGKLTADKFHLLLIPNPEINRNCYIGGPMLIEPYQTESLEYIVRGERQIDLSSLEFLFRVYIMD